MTRSVPLMGTIVTIRVVPEAGRVRPPADAARRIGAAFDWFHRVEASCSRFDPGSELSKLAGRSGPTPVSGILFEALRFALAVADASGGAFDPTIGRLMEARGFDRHYQTGAVVRTAVEADQAVSYRDVRLDPAARTVTLDRPLQLDLGAVAKGLAIDLAERELRPLANFAIDAGGDLYLAGRPPGKSAWTAGIRHPREDRQCIDAIEVSGAAVCTSGDYERRGAGSGAEHHLMDPRLGESPRACVSATVVAPTAMAADALATAAFVLGPAAGLRFLERHGVEGMIVSPALERHATSGFHSIACPSPLLPHAEGAAHALSDAARGGRGRRARGRPRRTGAA